MFAELGTDYPRLRGPLGVLDRPSQSWSGAGWPPAGCAGVMPRGLSECDAVGDLGTSREGARSDCNDVYCADDGGEPTYPLVQDEVGGKPVCLYWRTPCPLGDVCVGARV